MWYSAGMAAISWVYKIDILGVQPNGDYSAQCHATISDPAANPPTIGIGIMAPLITLPGDAPASWAVTIENGIIAAAAALSPPVTLTAVRTILPEFS
jgi:hypothetical protein